MLILLSAVTLFPGIEALSKDRLDLWGKYTHDLKPEKSSDVEIHIADGQFMTLSALERQYGYPVSFFLMRMKVILITLVGLQILMRKLDDFESLFQNEPIDVKDYFSQEFCYKGLQRGTG